MLTAEAKHQNTANSLARKPTITDFLKDEVVGE